LKLSRKAGCDSRNIEEIQLKASLYPKCLCDRIDTREEIIVLIISDILETSDIMMNYYVEVQLFDTTDYEMIIYT